MVVIEGRKTRERTALLESYCSINGLGEIEEQMKSYWQPLGPSQVDMDPFSQPFPNSFHSVEPG